MSIYNIKRINISIPEIVKWNRLKLCSLTVRVIFGSIYKSLFLQILFLITAILFLLNFTFYSSFLSFLYRFFIINTFTIALVIPLITSFEEILHAGICLRKGRFDLLHGISIIYFCTKRNNNFLFLGASIYFQGKTNNQDKIHIIGGAPLYLFVSFSLIFIMLITLGRNTVLFNLSIYVGIAIVIEALTLIPMNVIYKNDGWKVLTISKAMELSFNSLIRELLRSLIIAVSYLVCGTNYLPRESIEKVASIYVNRGNFSKAIDLLYRLLHKDPLNHRILNNIAWCYLKMNRYLNKAVILISKALELSPNKIDYLDTLKRIYYAKGEVDNANRVHQKITEIKRQSSSLPVVQSSKKQENIDLCKNSNIILNNK